MINGGAKSSGRRGPRLVLAIALGAAAAAGVYLYVSNVQQSAQQTARAAAQQQATAAATPTRPRVVVAKITVPAQTILTPDNAELREVATDAIQPNAATAMTDVQGKALTVPVAAGQQILAPFLANPDQPDIKKLADLVPAGKRASTYQIPEYKQAAAAFGDITLKAIQEADPSNPGTLYGAGIGGQYLLDQRIDHGIGDPSQIVGALGRGRLRGENWTHGIAGCR